MVVADEILEQMCRAEVRQEQEVELKLKCCCWGTLKDAAPGRSHRLDCFERRA
jgi:hypothetical protein